MLMLILFLLFYFQWKTAHIISIYTNYTNTNCTNVYNGFYISNKVWKDIYSGTSLKQNINNSLSNSGTYGSLKIKSFVQNKLKKRHSREKVIYLIYVKLHAKVHLFQNYKEPIPTTLLYKPFRFYIMMKPSIILKISSVCSKQS